MELTLISSNMFLLPPPISVDNKKRIDSFINLCLHKNPDFIVLQEVWLNKYVNLIKTKLPNYFFIGEQNTLYNKAGLLIFSKHKPQSFQKVYFDLDSKSALYDSIGRKGYLYTHFVINDQNIDILNLHLNSPYKGKQNVVWNCQLKTIEQFIQNNENSLIVAGDFNGQCDNLLYTSAPLLNMTEDSKSFSIKNEYRHKGFHRLTKLFMNIDIDKSDHDIDHVLFFPKNTSGSVIKELILDPVISDHYPIFAKIVC